MWCDAPLPLYFFVLVVVAHCVADHNLGRMGALDCSLSLLSPFFVAMSFFFQILLEYTLWTFCGLCLFIFLRDDVRHCQSDCGASDEVGSEDAD